METFSPGEDLVIKTRKPYTITKQRERWTEEEHNRFLEALKLYGRAWQRIEEHIGSKTAVQIRSHAQKFFSKLEKESLAKGVSLGQTLEIDIPPPRPKRKPSYPYPRKRYAGVCTSSSVTVKDGKSLTEVSAHNPGKEISDMENNTLSETPAGTENSSKEKGTLDEDNGSEVITLFQESSCVSVPSANKLSIPTSVVLTNSCTFREFVPSRKEKNNKTAMDESYLTVGPKQKQKLDRTNAGFTGLDNVTRKAMNLENTQGKLVSDDKTDEPKQPEKHGLLSTEEIQANQSYPKHVPVHIVDGSSGTCIQPESPSSTIYHVGGTLGNPYLFTIPTASATTEPSNNTSSSSVHQSMPNFLPFTPVLQNQDPYRSFLNISHTFPSLLMSTLLQNPAAHMAASLAASFWPYTNGETSVDSPGGSVGGFPFRHMSASQNLAAIAAATVTAASAWWATNGLLPLCPPIHPGFTAAPQPTTATPMDIGQIPAVSKDGGDRSPKDPPSEVQQLDPELSEATKPQHSTSKWPTPSSDSAESEGAKSNGTKLKSAGNEQKTAPVIGPHDDATKMKVRKKVNRSSCGSNTASSSEVETDVLEKQEKEEEEPIEPDASQQAGEINNRRCRSAPNMNESWKEVSQEGRLAFQALFSREVLPQSFSPPHDPKNNKGQPKNIIVEANQNFDEKDGEDPLRLGLSSKSWGTFPGHLSMNMSEGKNGEEGLLSVELGDGKSKARRTGFKPYKRCSVEAKESKMINGGSQGEEKGPKRIRLEGEPST